jgi:uncharacterized protein (TIGR02594 family)
MFTKLKLGDKNNDVVELQKILNRKLSPPPHLTEDGEFGDFTRTAVIDFQRTIGQATTGEVDFWTWVRLYLRRSKTSKHSNRSSFSIKKPLPPRIPNKAPHTDNKKEVVIKLSPSAPSWLKIAAKEIGNKEIKGPKSNQRIITYHSATTLYSKSDETHWCSSFANWVMNEAGYAGTNSAAAVSWKGWGKEITEPREGAITIIYRQPKKVDGKMTSSGNHVAFFISQTSTHLNLLGGNQSDMVKVSKFRKRAYKTIMYRWPTEKNK